MTEAIETAYANYLQATFEKQATLKLITALHEKRLVEEANALSFFLENGETTGFFEFKTSVWRNRKCWVGPQLPAQAQPGELWFDTVDLSTMILVQPPRSTQLSWIATHPVFSWQYRTFARLCQWKPVPSYFLSVNDLLSVERPTSIGPAERSFITNIYHEEAVAYAHWFGKFLTSRFDLDNAKSKLSPFEFGQVLPPKIRVWDETEFGLDESLRVAVGADTLEADLDEEYELLEEGRHPARPALFGEWEHNDKIGLSVMVPVQLGLLQTLPRRAFNFIELENTAPR